MKVSIIIPVYNVASYIEACIQSVFNQTYKNIEIIIVDDCGTDNSMEIIEKIISVYKGSFIIQILHHNQNQGLSAARNTGISHATGEYLYFLDSDDTISVDCITLLTAPILKGNNVDFVIADYQVIGATKVYPPLLLNDGIITENSNIINSYCQKRWYPMAVNKLIKKDFIIQNKLFFKEGLLHEDELWSFLLASSAKSMYVIKDKTYFYYIRNYSITTHITRRNLEAIATIIKEIRQIITDHKIVTNYHTYCLIEELKISSFIKKYKCNCRFNLYDIYKTIYFKNRITDITFRTLIKHPNKFLWEVQYHLPVKLGYYYCISLTKLFLFYKGSKIS